MRKIFALTMIALLALTMAIAVMGCGGGKKAEETPPASSEQPMASPDTGMHMGGDTTKTP